MHRTDHNKAQAAVELAVFGAILIFILGSIVRTAIGNSYQQSESFKAMRMAMLASWNDSKANPGSGPQVTAHNSAQVLFLEDRLSPDYNKYGDMDRTPFFVSGSGSFSYNLLYPLSNAADYTKALPVMDVYINGQHFPFTLAAYVPDWAVTLPYQPPAGYPSLPVCPSSGGAPPSTSGPISQQQCLQNQSCRYQREWMGGEIQEGAFNTSNPQVAPITPITGDCLSDVPGAAQRECQQSNNACTIFTDLAQAQIFSSTSSQTYCSATTKAGISPTWATQWPSFQSYYEASFPGNTAAENNQYLAAIKSKVQGASSRYKLFYTLVANPGENAPELAVSGGSTAAAEFSTVAPTCSSHPCANNELSQDVPLLDYNGNLTTDGDGASTNINGVMQYDLLRNADYSTATGVLSPNQFPTPNPGTPTTCSTCLRDYVAWQWAATAGTTADMIGLDASNNQYPIYDVDGRLKEVTIYNISQDSSGTTHIAYEDGQGGDIDGTWDANSCGPKPGLQEQSEMYTFTKNAANATNGDGGTYLEIKEGKLYNPETGLVVRSANKRDTIDLIQRTIQLSNNTGRFCNAGAPLATVANDGVTPNPVEVCVSESANASPASPGSFTGPVSSANDDQSENNCFTPANIAQTCYDTSLNIIFVRSRLEDRRGDFWMTRTSGKLQVH